MIPPIHTGDGTFSIPIERTSAMSILLPHPCPLRGTNAVVILEESWDGKFQNFSAAANIAKRVGGAWYIVDEGEWTAYLRLDGAQEKP